MAKIRFQPINDVDAKAYLEKEHLSHAIELLKTALSCLTTTCPRKIKEEYDHISHAIDTAERKLSLKLQSCPVRTETVIRLKIAIKAALTVPEELYATHFNAYSSWMEGVISKSHGGLNDRSLEKTSRVWIENTIKQLKH